MVPKYLLTKIKPEYSDILYNPTHFPGPIGVWAGVRQIALYLQGYNINIKSEICLNFKFQFQMWLFDKIYLSNSGHLG